MMTRYRVFVEDVGPGRFSAYGDRDVDAASPLDALFQITEVVKSSPVGKKWIAGELRPRHNDARLIALPRNRQDLWPHPTTGKVPIAALSFWYPKEKPRKRKKAKRFY